MLGKVTDQLIEALAAHHVQGSPSPARESLPRPARAQGQRGYPLLLELYGDHQAGLLSRDELLEALRLLEAYVFRRAVCAIPSNSQQKTFATFSRALRRSPGDYLPSFKAHLLDLPSYRRFPSPEP